MEEQIAIEASKKIIEPKGATPEKGVVEKPSSLSREQQLEARLIEMQAENQRLRFLLNEAQAQIGQLVREREALAEEVKELKQKPFKSNKKAKTKPTKKGGSPKKKKGKGRKRPEEVDYSEFITAGDQCPECDNAFSGKGVQRERTIEDIEPIRPTIVTRYIIERRWCPKCRKYQENPISTALPRYRLGLHTMLFVVYQKVALGLSYPKIQRELALYFGLRVSITTLINMVAEMSQRFGPAYAQLIQTMRQQAIVHIDETTWPVDGKRHWLWIFINDMVTLYVLSRSRGSKVPKALLGTDFSGTIVTDFFSAYSPLEVEKAKCWAHLLRDSHDLTKGQPPPDTERPQFHQQLHLLYLEMGLALEQVEADPSLREKLHLQMREKLLAFANRDWTDPDCLRLAARIHKYLDDLLLWLLRPDLASDNNAAERGLRPAVVTRKTSFGSRSRRGAQAFARLLSLIRTWEAQGLNFFDTASSNLS